MSRFVRRQGDFSGWIHISDDNRKILVASINATHLPEEMANTLGERLVKYLNEQDNAGKIPERPEQLPRSRRK